MCLPKAPSIKKSDISPLPEPEKNATALEVGTSPANRSATANRTGRNSLRIDRTVPAMRSPTGLQIPY